MTVFTALSEGVITDNGISYVAATFFVGLFGFLGVIAKGVFDAKKATTELRQSSEKTAESAEKAATNTTPVSNGFANSVVGKLESIDSSIHSLEKAFREHQEWHLRNERRK